MITTLTSTSGNSYTSSGRITISCGSATSIDSGPPARAAIRHRNDDGALRLLIGLSGGEDVPCPRRVRFRRGQVRPHERPDVGGPAPLLEALRGQRCSCA